MLPLSLLLFFQIVDMVLDVRDKKNKSNAYLRFFHKLIPIYYCKLLPPLETAILSFVKQGLPFYNDRLCIVIVDYSR